jgi:hypothetical protein
VKPCGLRWIVAVVAVFSSPFALAVDWEYAVRPGESLWQIAHRYCGNERGVDRLARHNGLKSPSALRAGVVLRIPVDCLIRQPVNAKLLEADATATLERAGIQLTPSAGDEIHMGDTLTTGASFAVVEFADQSRLTIRPHSVISFVMLTAHGESGMVDTLLRLRKGRVQHAVEKGGGQNHEHRIATPVGAAAVRGTKFRVEILEGEVATVATTEGEVGFSQISAASTPVPAGQGLVATVTSSRTEPLLPAPVIGAALRAGVGSSLGWGEVADATAYRVTLFKQAKPVAESVVAVNHWAVDAPLGMYTLTVRAVAPSGLEGLDATATLEVVPAAPSGQVATADHAGTPVQFRWTPSSDDPGPFVVRVRSATGSIKEYPTQSPAFELVLEAGAYDWQVQSNKGTESGWFPLSLKPGAPLGLIASRQKRDMPLLLSLEATSQSIAAYRVEIHRSGQLVVERDFEPASMLSIDGVPNCHPCQVRVAATAADLESDYTQLEYRDPPGHPWPIYVVLALLAIAL